MARAAIGFHIRMAGKELSTVAKPALDGGATGLLHNKALPPFAALRAFEAVGREGGIRRAAVALSLDHAVVSRHMRLLEDWLGVLLFKRGNGQLAFTEIGARYHARVSEALIELVWATSEIMADEEQKSLRLWCVPGFAAQWVSGQLAEFERRQPEYQVELRPTDVTANLMAHEADIDIRYYGDAWLPDPGGKGLKFVELARPNIMMVASPAVAKRLSSLCSMAELLDGPLLHEEHDEQWKAYFRLNGVEPGPRLAGPLLWHAHMAIAAARLGRGVALASKYLVGNDLANGSLVELTLPGARQVPLGFYGFVTREDRWSLRAIANLRRFLQAAAAG